MNLIKKYWKLLIVLSIIFLLAAPKFIDWLFSIYMCDLTALNYLEASDILTYFGTIFTVVAAAIGIWISIKQFSLLNRTLIIPLNQKYYYYHSESQSFLSNRCDIPRSQHSDYVMGGFPHVDTKIELKNIGKGNAVNFAIEYDFTEGKNLIKQLCVDFTDSDEEFEAIKKSTNCGIFLSGESRYLELSNTFYKIIRDVCQWQHFNYSSKKNEFALKNNILVNTEKKICSINIKSSDFLDITQDTNNGTYGVYLSVSPSISLSSTYSKYDIYSEVSLTMKKEK